MKIRYYLRGLGIGILVTAVFFMVSNRNLSPTMSDEQVKARAKELGMIESTVLAEIPSETVPETIVEEAVESSVESTEVEESVTEVTTEVVTEAEPATEQMMETETAPMEEPESEARVESEPESEAEPETKTEEVPKTNEQSAPNTEPISIIVNRGEGSDTVSRRLQEMGLVADAYKYDRYLMANGYDKRIGAGEHVIPAGATWEEIAKVLCN